MHISAKFDSGNIEVVSATSTDDIQLRVRADAGDQHYQWFHFRVSGVRGQPLRARIVNAAGASYPKAWQGYQAAASYDRQTWFRTQTSVVDGELVIEHTAEHDSIWFAYFAPYSLQRHHDLIARTALDDRVSHQVLGTTLDGRDVDLLVLGEPGDNKPVLWIIARQHPGESMAEWFMEGLLERLTDRDDALAGALLQNAVIYAVPNMNPDGSFRGHLRCNAVGANLNREWHDPSLQRSPEVKVVRDRMDQTGVHFCLDVHGDEELPYNFIAGPDPMPSLTQRQTDLQAQFLEAFVRATPDFQTTHGYPIDKPNMSMCTQQCAHRYGALALTLEMPFKDNADRPDPQVGWSPGRAKALGASVLHPIVHVLDGIIG
ncbi:MAG: murein tripeptide amidase MpaA [Kiritimatiellia bacterium]|jgi:murein tripeptide amidase MpaA